MKPIFIVSTVVLALYALAAIYCYPQADDISYAIKSIEHGFWPTQLSEYNEWNGRYFATAILTMSPLTWGKLWHYRLAPIGLITLLWLSLGVLLLSLKSRFQLLKLQPWPWATIIAALFAAGCPDVAQAFYWFAASMTYTLPIILFNFCIAIYLKNNLRNWFWRIGRWLFMAALIAAMIGCDETIMVIFDYLIFGAVILNYRQTKKINFELAAIGIFALLCSYFVVMAPGNSIRGSYFEHRHDVIRTVGNLLQFTLQYPVQFLSVSLIVLVILTRDEILEHFSSGWLYANRKWVLLFWLGITTIACFPSSWAMGGQPNLRTRDLIYYFFLVGSLPVAALYFKNVNFRLHKFKMASALSAILFLISVNNDHLIKGYFGEFSAYNSNWLNMISGGKDTLTEPQKTKILYFDDLNHINAETFDKFKKLNPNFYGN